MLPQPTLSRKEAMDLWLKTRKEYASNPDADAKAKLDYAMEQVVLSNTGLVVHVLNSMSMNPLDEDLFATGVEGMVRAMKGYDESKGAFSTYACRVIHNQLLVSIRKKRVDEVLCLNAPISDVDGDIYMEDIIPDKDNLEGSIIRMDLERMLSTMSEKERTIFIMIMKGSTMEEIGRSMGQTRSNVSRIWKRIKEEILHSVFDGEYCF